MIEFRRAIYEDIPRIMEYIDKNWKKNHILSQDKKFFEWQYMGKDRCNFIIAEDKLDKKIYGINGFITYNSSINPDIAGSIFKVIKSGNPILGLEMSEFLCKTVNHRYVCAPGLSEKAVKIERLSKNRVEKLKHYYILADKLEYNIAIINNKYIKKTNCERNLLREFSDYKEIDKILSEEKLKYTVPFKDKKYLKHRYFEHPIYKYKYFAIDNGFEMSKSVFIGREVEYNGAKILKLVDFLGDDNDINDLSYSFENLIEKNKYEFIDFYCYGIDEKILKNAGFILRDENDKNIIPNYFEPFVQDNIEIYFTANTFENLHMYRADGDQDRPSFAK